ncbi:MAG: hypothetical protein U0X40_01865 [Ferruginibacter sp.]
MPLLILALLSDGATDLLGSDHWFRNFVFIIYTPLEYLLLCLIIASYLHNKTIRKIIYISIPVFIIISLVDQLWLKEKGSYFYDYLDVLIENPLICVWTLFYFFQLASDNNELSFRNNPMFWVCLGNLLFYSATSFSYGFGGYLKHIGNKEYADIVDFIGKVFNLLLYFFYIIAFSCTWTRKKF